MSVLSNYFVKRSVISVSSNSKEQWSKKQKSNETWSKSTKNEFYSNISAMNGFEFKLLPIGHNKTKNGHELIKKFKFSTRYFFKLTFPSVI